MVKYTCDAKGCNFTSTSRSAIKRIHIDENNTVLGTLSVATYDMCPNCYEKFLNMHKSFFKQEDMPEESEEDTGKAKSSKEALYDPAEFNAIFAQLISDVVDYRFNNHESHTISYYGSHYANMNYMLIDIMRNYFAGMSASEVAEEFKLSIATMNDLYTALENINHGTVDISKDPAVGILKLIEKYWLNDEIDLDNFDYSNFSYYIFFVVYTIAGYMKGENYTAVADSIHMNSYTVECMYVTLDKILFETPFTARGLQKVCGELVTLRDMVAAMLATEVDVEDDSFVDKVAEKLGSSTTSVLTFIHVYKSIYKDIVKYYTNEYNNGKLFEQIPNKYYLTKRTINELEKAIKLSKYKAGTITY